MFCSIYRKPDLLLATGSITAKLAFPVDLQERGRLEKDGRREVSRPKKIKEKMENLVG